MLHDRLKILQVTAPMPKSNEARQDHGFFFGLSGMQNENFSLDLPKITDLIAFLSFSGFENYHKAWQESHRIKQKQFLNI